jgi:hypothetical protein
MIKYDHFVCKDAQEVTNTLETSNIQPNQIVSITSKVLGGDTYRWEHTSLMDIHVDTYYVVFYWYEE